MTRRYFAIASSMRFASRARSASSMSVRATSGTSSCARATGATIVNAITARGQQIAHQTFAIAAAIERKTPNPSVLPSSASAASLRMRHHPEHVAARVADAGDVARASRSDSRRS